MINLFTGAAAAGTFVFLKAFQQRNVAFDQYAAIMPTSIAMAFAEFYVVALIVTTGYDVPLVISLGTGAGFGAMAAMYTHGKIFRRK